MIIALDGPAGAGKSTVAKAVARELGLFYLDTGAMYRAVTLAVLERGVDPSASEACARVAHEVALDFDEAGCVRVDGRPGEPDIRSRTVTRNVSAVSAHADVRTAVVAVQRALAEARGGLVAEGRDTTTVVFPDADHKFFLNASQEERARRRARQEAAASDAYETILADIARRDRLDSTRAHSPLVRSPEAIVIEADEMSADEVVAAILERIRAGSGRG